MFLPSDLNTFGILFYAVFGIFAVLLGFLDYFELWAMRYSKFRTEKGVPSRLGMFILYFLPVITATVFALPYLPSASLTQWLVYAAIMIHFLKRTYEVLFLHKYSGPIQPLTFVIIVVTYALIAGLISALNAQAIPAVDALFVVGIVLFVIGQIGNFYHHKLLADLRKKEDGYHIPRGGWFEKATCPHYFFELLAWVGILLLSRHLFTLLAFIAMFGYLTARSVKTRQWYRQRFPDYPAERKNMIPFLF
jgi:protein-S-isoprenylcysteine O-methyltransferase Ste14